MAQCQQRRRKDAISTISYDESVASSSVFSTGTMAGNLYSQDELNRGMVRGESFNIEDFFGILTCKCGDIKGSSGSR